MMLDTQIDPDYEQVRILTIEIWNVISFAHIALISVFEAKVVLQVRPE
jgi:hypothetical protein